MFGSFLLSFLSNATLATRFGPSAIRHVDLRIKLPAQISPSLLICEAMSRAFSIEPQRKLSMCHEYYAVERFIFVIVI